MSSPSTTTPGTEVIDAVHSLSRVLGPHVTIVALIVLLANPSRIFPSISDPALSYTPTTVLLGAAFCLGGFAKLAKGSEGLGGNQSPSNSSGASSEDSSPLGIYLKGAIFFFIASHIPWQTTFPLHELPVTPWTLTGAVAAAVFLLTLKLRGPIHFAYSEVSRRLFQLHTPEWWIYAAILPSLVTSLSSAFALGILGFFYTYHAYHTQLRSVSEAVSKDLSTVKLALITARELATDARRYEDQLLNRATQSLASRERSSSLGSATAILRKREDADHWSGALTSVSKSADEASQLAERALVAATRGDIQEAKELATAVKAIAVDADVSLEVVRRGMDNARGQLLGWLEGR